MSILVCHINLTLLNLQLLNKKLLLNMDNNCFDIFLIKK